MSEPSEGAPIRRRVREQTQRHAVWMQVGHDVAAIEQIAEGFRGMRRRHAVIDDPDLRGRPDRDDDLIDRIGVSAGDGTSRRSTETNARRRGG